MAVFIGRKNGKCVKKNWVAVAVLQLRLRLCGVGVWVYIETCQKMPRIAFAFGVLIFLFINCACCVISDGKKTCGGRASSWSRDG
jgi:hypothetical protein